MAPSIAYCNPLLKEDDHPSPTSSSQTCFHDELYQLQPEGHHVFQPQGFPKQSRIDGEYWPPIFLPQSVRGAKKMIPRDGDLFVCTYPKCGTTWIQHICAQLMNENYGPAVGNELCKTSPMIERMGAEFADKLPSPRILKTHFAWNNLPKSPKAKYIYAARNPKDCLTSYFFHNQNFKIYNFENGSFDNFFDLFMSEKIGFGSYFHHLLSWLPHVNDDNVLFLRYEDMCADLRTAVIRIGHFLGGRAAQKVEDESVLEQIVRDSQFDAMKKNESRWFPAENLRGKPFIRKGGSRDWKNSFSKEQSSYMDSVWKATVRGTIAESWWREELAWDLEEDEGFEEKFYNSGPCAAIEGFDSADLLSIKSFNQQSLAIPISSSRQHLSSVSDESGFGSFDDSYLRL